MKKPESYVPIHCRSHYSLLRGIYSPEKLVDFAVQMAAPAVGLVDINGFYGLIRFAQAADRRGLKALYGSALYDGRQHLCTLLCLGKEGFARANEILSAHIDSQEGRREAYDPIEDLLQGGWRGLWVVSSRIEVLERLLRAGDSGLYAGLPYGVPYGTLRRWAAERGLPLLAYNDAVYRSTEDLHFYRLLRAIGSRRMFSEIAPGGGLNEARRMVEGREMESFFSAVPEALENARRFALIAEGFQLPRGFFFPRFAGLDEEEAFSRLRQLCEQGIRRRYGVLAPSEPKAASPVSAGPGSGGEDGPVMEGSGESFGGESGGGAAAAPAGKESNGKELRDGLSGQHGTGPADMRRRVRERLDYELNIIRRKGFSSYFLVVHDIVSQVPRTCGRGSAAAGIVSYLLGITHVDPLRHNLFFERFLNMGRQDPPDIDVDFPWDERDLALAYVFRTYRSRAAMVADHVTFARRSAIREPARVMGYEREQLRKLSRSWRHGRLADLPKELRDVVPRLYGMPRHIGTHPGGVVITPTVIHDYSHVQTSALGWPLLAWEKDAVEETGLVKIDLLGNRSLGVFRDSISLINRRHGTSLQWESFSPLRNSRTREMIASGDTLGVFYVESPATRQLLKKMGRGDYEHLVIASSIIRPAANRLIGEFLRRLRGGQYDPLPEPADSVLRESYGIMVYQEDVSRIAVAVAGFDASEADRLRKVLSKKDREFRLPLFKERFFRGAQLRGFENAVIEELWKSILSFDGYSFCKAHSASYALLSYRLAWVKRFFPLEFYVSVINNGGGFYSRQVYLNALRRRGYTILGPDVNSSGLRFRIEDGAVRIGLGQLRDLGQRSIERILSDRQERGSYGDFDDFCRRVELDIAAFRALNRAGALDSLAGPYTRPQMFWLFYHREAGGSLFLAPPLPSVVGDYSSQVKLMDEFRSMGLIVSRHPLDIFMDRARRLVGDQTLVDSRGLARLVGRRVFIAGFLVTEKELRTSRHEEMSFVSFEDPYGIFETVFFPQAYRRLAVVLERGGAFLLRAVVEEDWGSLQLQVHDVRSLSRPRQPEGF